MVHVLHQLERPTHPDLLVGTETFDDAGVVRIAPDLALVQTVDFFPPLVDDPYEFGRIAAVNALSDVYAMGGEPLSALNIVGFPDKELDPQVLVDILRGGAHVLRSADTLLVGGHSVRDAEVKYGLAVTGRVHPDRIWTNAAARPGDRLVLTKPLGSGVLTTAVKQGKLPEAELAEAIHVMTTLNRAARDVAVRFDSAIHACTDITGFGLIGHAREIAAGSGVCIVLEAGRVPLMRHVAELAAVGVLTRAHRSTREFLGAALHAAAGVPAALLNVLLDAQTSGGLLFAVAPASADALRTALEAAGVPCAADVGFVTDGEPGAVEVRP